MRLTHEPLVSIVTPVYNGDKYLRECIESVLAQSYTHWDYTIVNNCSTDRTLEIAHQYADRDGRIRIHNNEKFVRIITNYNIAFRQISSQSKYCKVVAADDQLFPECLEKMVRLVEANPRVAIVGAYGLKETMVLWQGLPYPSTVVNGRELCRSRLLGAPYVFGTPTALLFRSDVARSRHAFFNESNLHADSEVCLEFLEDHDFGFVHEVLTFQGVQEESLSSFSQRYQTYLPWILYELITYGPKYLDKNELKDRIRQHLHAYYGYLGEQVYKRRGREFWSFHQNKLASMGYKMSIARLTASAGAYAIDLLLNPKKTIELLIERICRMSINRRNSPKQLTSV